MKVRASCLCRAIRLELEIAPGDHMEHCHCGMCRKAHGAAFATWIDLPPSAVRIDGELTFYESSPGARRGFCGRCGSSIAWRRDGTNWISIAAGVLDDDPGIRPRRNIYVASRAPWAPLDRALECYDENRPAPERPE